MTGMWTYPAGKYHWNLQYSLFYIEIFTDFRPKISAEPSSPGFGIDSKMMVMIVRCVPHTATHCRRRLTLSREHALWTPQQWSCVMFSDEPRFSLQSDSCRTLIWRAPGTRYHQKNTIERHRYGHAG
ncbi:uncharacterized protein TNCV_3899461 [Trichonephila clavipes]|nr:uncharacterized protein TNCV_3899461 [Trichonephila clavipes]